MRTWKLIRRCADKAVLDSDVSAGQGGFVGVVVFAADFCGFSSRFGRGAERLIEFIRQAAKVLWEKAVVPYLVGSLPSKYRLMISCSLFRGLCSQNPALGVTKTPVVGAAPELPPRKTD